ncbi:transposable element Tcb2 transposase [Trichonephila clavipes]|nr:transposable element Tcb2 transposase [Trichonephila clavipes]
MNQASICGAMMATFVLDAMLVNVAFQSALSNDIGAYHQELWSGVQFRIMDDPICYELRQVWDLIVWHLARDLCQAVSKDDLLLGIQAIWNILPQADIQKRFDSMPRRTAAVIAVRGS